MNPTSKHLGVIADGGRRWAEKFCLPLAETYRISFWKLSSLLKLAKTYDFSEASVYILSTANLKRSASELEAVFVALDALHGSMEKLCQEGDCRSIRLIGKPSLLPDSAQKTFASIASLSNPDGGMRINLLVGYDPWDEVREACKKSGGFIEMEHLWVDSRVDVIIRTAGATLLSGFLPLQSQYSHIITTVELFNELTDDDLEAVIKKATATHNQYGK